MKNIQLYIASILAFSVLAIGWSMWQEFGYNYNERCGIVAYGPDDVYYVSNGFNLDSYLEDKIIMESQVFEDVFIDGHYIEHTSIKYKINPWCKSSGWLTPTNTTTKEYTIRFFVNDSNTTDFFMLNATPDGVDIIFFSNGSINITDSRIECNSSGCFENGRKIEFKHKSEIYRMVGVD